MWHNGRDAGTHAQSNQVPSQKTGRLTRKLDGFATTFAASNIQAIVQYGQYQGQESDVGLFHKQECFTITYRGIMFETVLTLCLFKYPR